MRLTPFQIDVIKRTAAEFLGPEARITLFGSRIHDQQKGGDVDLYVEVPHLHLMQKIRCKVQLEERLDLPVDLIVKPIGDNSPISRIAKLEGINL
jgi:predicted nucleotidyltransferase